MANIKLESIAIVDILFAVFINKFNDYNLNY